jgi:rhombotail lipoprotein
MTHRFRARALGTGLLLLLAACVTSRPASLKSSALDYLYPKGKAEATPARDVKLRVPVRVGLAFAPGAPSARDPFTEVQKRSLLARIADAFREKEFISSLELIPTTYLTPGGSFEEIDRLAAAFGVDLIALVSYDQHQFTETTNLSWTYLTVVGAFAIRGEKNETRTLLDAAVYDIASRALLFRAAGESSIKGSSTPVAVDRALRKASEEGFETATGDLVAHLETALEAFREQAKTGTVRGAGTPAVQIVHAAEGGGAGGGAGSVGAGEALVAAALLAGLAVMRRRLPGGPPSGS